MSTDQLERLLANSLHENDSQTVDVQGGRSALRERIEQDRRAVRRRAVIGIAAAVVTVVVTTSLLVTGALRKDQAVPVHPSPPKVAVSRSGLPVGLLEGQFELNGVAQLFRLLVEADGTGQFSPGVGHSALAIGVAFDVRMRPEGPGRVALVYSNPVLTDPEVVTLHFSVSEDSVTITRIDTPGNGVLTKVSAQAIAGIRLQVLPAPPSDLCCPG
jgi:hypothetical protein